MLTEPSVATVLPVIQTPWQNQWQPELIGTLVFLVDNERVLLIEKLTGHGQGKINGPGGKWEAGESLLQCARRETLEETGLMVDQLTCAAELRFVEQAGPQWLGYVFVAEHCAGELTQTREAKPFWCDMNAIPYASMWADDAIWLPRVLEQARGQKPFAAPFVQDFLFNDGELLAFEPAKQAELSFSVSQPRAAQPSSRA